MFLNQLSYQEKKMFLDLSVHVAKANGVFATEEKAMISSYCTEMQLPPIELYETEPIETVTSYYALADEHVKKIVLLEALGLAYADGSFDEAEVTFLKTFAEGIGVSEEVYNKLRKAINDYYKVCKELGAVIE